MITGIRSQGEGEGREDHLVGAFAGVQLIQVFEELLPSFILRGSQVEPRFLERGRASRALTSVLTNAILPFSPNILRVGDYRTHRTQLRVDTTFLTFVGVGVRDHCFRSTSTHRI